MTAPLVGHERPFSYVGSELDLFSGAHNWKAYWASALAPYMRGDVIEVGAGIGGSTKFLCDAGQRRWLCLEPDPKLAEQIERRIASGELPDCCHVRRGVLSDLDAEERADTIVYIDVLEHIADDVEEVRCATGHLRSGGRLVVLSPAFNSLYSPFDRAVGHYRRYTRRDVHRLTVTGLRIESVFFLDSLGLFASAANRLFLRSPMPSSRQIEAWDRRIVPVSRYVDRLFHRLFGRTIVMVWQKDA
jgi:SAM-dependent methyltransferase